MKMPNNTVRSAANYMRDKLKGIYTVSETNQVISIVFSHYFGWSRAELLLNQDNFLSESELLKIIHAVKALKKNMPLAHILGEWEFYGLKLKIDQHTLIPRPETEELVQLILNENDNGNVLDIGTGSGCIALALKHCKPQFKVTGWDISQEALTIAKQNANEHDLEVDFKQVDITNPMMDHGNTRWDVMVSNPPYIPLLEKESMDKNVVDFEPELALFVPNENPLKFYQLIADFAGKSLRTGGKLYFEIHEKYGEETKQMLIEKSFVNVEVIRDINGKDRIIKSNLVN